MRKGRLVLLVGAFVSIITLVVFHSRPTVSVLMVSEDGDGGDPRDRETQSSTIAPKEEKASMRVSHRAHAFYYAWYANPEFDDKYLHWNHDFLPHWNPQIDRTFPKGAHTPPDDIGANFYPSLGAYSSRDPRVIDDHFRQLSEAAVGVIAVSWYNPDRGDGQGQSPDPLVPALLEACQLWGLKLAFHMEPFPGRTPRMVKSDVEYIFDRYGNHPALYRHPTARGDLPVFYIYDSYQSDAAEWAEVLSKGGSDSLRGTRLDALFIGLLVEHRHKSDIVQGGFDGFYTYFAADGFTYGSSRQNWKLLADFAEEKSLIFIPSVGPGYVDTRVRLWNGANIRSRKEGKEYEQSFEEALKVSPSIISITSFNEWHEGTQIEEAVPKAIPGYTYEDYSPHSPSFYLQETRRHLASFDPLALSP